MVAIAVNNILGSNKVVGSVTHMPRFLFKKSYQVSAGYCGNVSWPIEWQLSARAGNRGGYIIQTVSLNLEMNAGINQASSSRIFMEAWHINPGAIRPDIGGWRNDLFYAPEYPMPSSGDIEIEGSATYYDGLTLPNDFVPGGAVNSGILPSTYNPRAFLGGTNSISHNLHIKWDCMGSRKQTEVLSAN
jgi:hypothetical protein